MTNSMTKPPVWFWIVSVVALIWNGMGVMQYLAKAYATDEMIAALPAEQQAEFLAEHPAWYTAAFAIAVFAGALGCLALILRKKWAYMLLLLSLLGVIVQMSYITFKLDMANVMTGMIVLVSIALVWFAKQAIAKEWIS